MDDAKQFFENLNDVTNNRVQHAPIHLAQVDEALALTDRSSRTIQ